MTKKIIIFLPLLFLSFELMSSSTEKSYYEIHVAECRLPVPVTYDIQFSDNTLIIGDEDNSSPIIFYTDDALEKKAKKETANTLKFAVKIKERKVKHLVATYYKLVGRPNNGDELVIIETDAKYFENTLLSILSKGSYDLADSMLDYCEKNSVYDFQS